VNDDALFRLFKRKKDMQESKTSPENWMKSLIKSALPDATLQWIRDQRDPRRRQFGRSLRPDDTFLVGHPKSGNTWIAYMLASLMEKRVGGTLTLANVRDFLPLVHNRDWEINRYNHLPSPRVFRNEAPHYSEKYPKTIYIVRDPRAAFVSYYHHCLHDLESPGWPMKEFVAEMLAHGCIRRLEPQLVRWDRQVSIWLERARHQAVHIVRYEDLQKDCRKELLEIVRFMDLKCAPIDIDNAVDRGSFKNMRRDEQLHGAEPYSGDKGEKGFFVRRGKVDGWEDELTPELARQIESAFRLPMQKLGYL